MWLRLRLLFASNRSSRREENTKARHPKHF
jgi:hypothetical protein